MVKRVVTMVVVIAMVVGCLGMVGFAAEVTTGTSWEFSAATGFEGVVSTYNIGSSTAVSTGNVVFANPDGWYLDWHGSTWRSQMNSTAYTAKLRQGANFDGSYNRDFITVFRANSTGLVSPHFFTENRSYRISFDVAAAGVLAENGVSLVLCTTRQPNGFARYDVGSTHVPQYIGKKTIPVKQSEYGLTSEDFTRLTYEFTANPVADDLGLKIAFEFPGGKPETGNCSIIFDNFMIEKGTPVTDIKRLTTWTNYGDANLNVTLKESSGDYNERGTVRDGNDADSRAIRRDCTWGDNTGFIIRSNKFNFTKADIGKIVTVKFNIAPYGFKATTPAEDCKVRLSSVMQYQGSGEQYPSKSFNMADLGYAYGSPDGGDIAKAKFTELTHRFVVTSENLSMNQIEVRMDITPFKNGDIVTGDNKTFRYLLDNIRIYEENSHVFKNVDSSYMIYGPENVNLNSYLAGAYDADNKLLLLKYADLNKFTAYVDGMKYMKAFAFENLDKIKPLVRAITTN